MNLMFYAKALYGAISAGLASLLIAYSDEILTKYEIVVVVTAVVTAFGIIWGVPNASARDND